jgi:hypothetical protein
MFRKTKAKSIESYWQNCIRIGHVPITSSNNFIITQLYPNIMNTIAYTVYVGVISCFDIIYYCSRVYLIFPKLMMSQTNLLFKLYFLVGPYILEKYPIQSLLFVLIGPYILEKYPIQSLLFIFKLYFLVGPYILEKYSI